MRALVYHGPGQKAWEEVPDPELTDDGDVIVQVDATTICGTDLHILAGDVPEVTPGRILGHEAVGTVVEAGDGVHRLSPGDRVLVSCISACGTCRFCREGRYGQCLDGGGWVLGHRIDGTQAEYVRVPYADTSTYRIPAGAADEEILMLADILPTGYEVGVLAGGVRPGGRIANIGVHGKPATLHLEEQWTRDITITTGLVDASSTPTLMRLVTSGQLDASRFVTHRFGMDEFDKAYDVFGEAATSGALKVVLTR
jgi:threonine dehydrogenase-like Zn-dependent dehydrogenase